MSESFEPHFVWITLGSNIRPEHYLPEAVESLSLLGEVKKCSSVWQSAPVGDPDQADFCNAALLLETELELDELRHSLRMVETQLDRVRDPDNKNAARTIDLDIAFFNSFIVETSEITIPDPEIANRPFLAVPLAELTPDYVHPLLKVSLKELAERAPDAILLKRRDDISLPQ